ncbi:MAG: glycosyltransferase family 39 protein [Mailhella sp.]|nr:glycosyltransferase family 39 protein [Mailhella sp.]
MDETKDRVDTIQDENLLKETTVPAEEQPLAPETEPAEPVLAESDEVAMPAEGDDAETIPAAEAAEDGVAAEQDITEDAPLEADGEQPAEEDSPLVMPEPDMMPEESVAPVAPAPAPIPAGPAEKIFNGLSYIGLPVLLLFAVAMSFLEVWQIRDLWFADEMRLADVFMNVKKGDWLVLTMNGMPYPDNPPLYFWFMDALTRIPGFPVSVPMAMFLAVVVSHALFIGSIWALARGTGFDRRVAFASGLVALSCVYLSGVATYPNIDLLFAAFVTLGMTCLYRGWIKSFAPFWLALGWLFMAAATLTQGPLGIAFAVVTSVLFLFWRCTPGRLNSRDGLPGFFLMLLVLAGWLGVLYLDGHTDYIRAMIGEQLVGHIQIGWHNGEVWWYYLAALPIIWLPWILLPLFVNWFRALRGIPNAVRTRKTDGGSSWLWIWLVTGIDMLSCVQDKTVVYALPLLAPLTVLTARSLLKLSAGGSRCFFGLSAAIFAVAGLALVILDVYPFIQQYIPAAWQSYIPGDMLPWIETLDGTMYMGGVLILTAVALLSLTRLALPGGSLLVTAIGMMLMLQPYHWFVVPSMGELLKPQAQASVMTDDVKTAGPAAAAPAETPAQPAAPEPPAAAAPAEAQPAPSAEVQPAPTAEPKAETPAPEAAPAEEPKSEAPAAPAPTSAPANV